MSTNAPEPTRLDAEALLAAAQQGRGVGAELSRRSVLPALTSIVVGVLLAAFLLGAVYVAPEAGVAFWIASSIAFAVVLSATMIVFVTHRTALPARWARNYLLGLFVSVALYLGGVGLAVSGVSTSPLLWVPVAIAVALPVAALGSLRGTR